MKQMLHNKKLSSIVQMAGVACIAFTANAASPTVLSPAGIVNKAEDYSITTENGFQCKKNDRIARYEQTGDKDVTMVFQDDDGILTVPLSVHEVAHDDGVKLSKLWCDGMDVPKYMEVANRGKIAATIAKINKKSGPQKAGLISYIR